MLTIMVFLMKVATITRQQIKIALLLLNVEFVTLPDVTQFQIITDGVSVNTEELTVNRE